MAPVANAKTLMVQKKTYSEEHGSFSGQFKVIYIKATRPQNITFRDKAQFLL